MSHFHQGAPEDDATLTGVDEDGFSQGHETASAVDHDGKLGRVENRDRMM